MSAYGSTEHSSQIAGRLSSLRAYLLPRPWSGYLVAVVMVGIALLVRAALETLGTFYYLPMVPAVVATAVLTGRSSTLLCLVLSISANTLMVDRDDPLDTATNAVLFALVSWLIAEICWTLRDLQTEAGSLSERLARRDRMLDTLMVSVPVVILDQQGIIRLLTPPARSLLGTTDAAAVGHSFTRFVETFEIDAVALKSDAPSPDHHWIGKREDGMAFPLNIQMGVMATNAHADYAILCLTDLTQAHAADARARELHTQLNRVWRLNSLGEMAASLAHELNQPLSAATSYLHAGQTDLKTVGLMGQSASRTIDLAKAQLLRAGSIIRHMRDLLAHESRSLRVVRVSEMIEDLGGVVAMMERNSGTRIEIDVDDRDDRVRAESIQIQQALINLVRNADEALANRLDPSIRITGRAVSTDVFELRVEDNGPGIPPEQVDTIFRPLITTKTGGMGLGLSVTRTIVESHGGVLRVETSVMGGAAFSFGLIREREDEEA